VFFPAGAGITGCGMERINHLERERKRRGWTRQRLAAKLADLMDPDEIRPLISLGQIGRWERGESQPEDYWIEKLCTVYEQSAEELGLFHAVGDDDPTVNEVTAPRVIHPISPIADVSEQLLSVQAQSINAERAIDGPSALVGASAPIGAEDDPTTITGGRGDAPHPHERDHPGTRHNGRYTRRWGQATPGGSARSAHISRHACWAVLAAVTGLFATYLLLTLTPFAAHGLSLTSLTPFDGAIEGYLIAVEKRGNQDVLVALDPRTGITHQLAPQSPPLIEGNSSVPASEDESLIAPAYSSARHMLAYIAISDDGATSVWITPLATPANSVPQLDVAQSRRLIANCGPSCKTLTWSPSGGWLIFESSSGLMAVEADTGDERIITQGAHDAWPACSPNGSLLVYQRAVESLGYLVSAPAEDCIPTAEAVAHARLVGSAVISWHPMWSLDGKMLAYVSATTGKRVFVLDALGLFAGPTDSDATPFHSVSPVGCGDPVWITEAQSHRNLVLFICSTQSGQRLAGALADEQDGSLFAVGAPRDGEPALYNPIWVAP